MNSKQLMQKISAGEILVSDGATGTNLLVRGLPSGMPSDIWVLENPEQILKLHREFIEAGSNILLTCTFGATSARLEQNGLGEKASELNTRAVELARQAAGEKEIFIAGSMGPTGHMLEPFGTMSEADAIATYTQQAKALIEAGVDLIVIETQFDLTEARAAIQAVRSQSSLPLVCSFSFDRGTRTMMGISPTQLGKELSGSGVNLLGINCGRSIEDNYKSLQELRQATDLPIWFKPNAGMPRVDAQDRPIYDLTPEMMASHVPEWIAAGAQIIGGCCGTSPDHLRKIAEAVQK